jgi:uridine phosphorylase
MPIPSSELVLNADGSIYHLHLLPEQIAPTIITVGDPDRVSAVSRHFDRMDCQVQKREFVTHTGYVGNKRLTVISTGIGTDNIDIVLNELDALVNIDLHSRLPKSTITPLTIVRLGTSGGLQPDIPVHSIVASAVGVGFDGLMHYYKYKSDDIETNLAKAFGQLENGMSPYFSTASPELLQKIAHDVVQGMTATCSGFYGPQGRRLRLEPQIPDLLDQLQAFSHANYRFTNLEMETAGIYALAKALGHQALSLNVILANRPRGEFSQDPKAAVEKLITWALERIVAL